MTDALQRKNRSISAKRRDQLLTNKSLVKENNWYNGTIF